MNGLGTSASTGIGFAFCGNPSVLRKNPPLAVDVGHSETVTRMFDFRNLRPVMALKEGSDPAI